MKNQSKITTKDLAPITACIAVVGMGIAPVVTSNAMPIFAGLMVISLISMAVTFVINRR